MTRPTQILIALVLLAGSIVGCGDQNYPVSSQGDDPGTATLRLESANAEALSSLHPSAKHAVQPSEATFSFSGVFDATRVTRNGMDLGGKAYTITMAADVGSSDITPQFPSVGTFPFSDLSIEVEGFGEEHIDISSLHSTLSNLRVGKATPNGPGFLSLFVASDDLTGQFEARIVNSSAIGAAIGDPTDLSSVSDVAGTGLQYAGIGCNPPNGCYEILSRGNTNPFTLTGVDGNTYTFAQFSGFTVPYSGLLSSSLGSFAFTAGSLSTANNPPTANAGPNQPVECAGTSTSVTLDGSGSSDSDGSIASYTWTGSFGTASGVNPTVALAHGSHTISLTVTDDDGDTATDEVVANIVDTTPPTVSLTVNPTNLWPPNHTMHVVATSVSAADVCGLESFNVTVTSDEPINGTGDGDTEPDWEVVDNGDGTFDVSVRAERAGGGDGRVYTITATATDDGGNTTSDSKEVTVAHDKGKGKK